MIKTNEAIPYAHSARLCLIAAACGAILLACSSDATSSPDGAGDDELGRRGNRDARSRPVDNGGATDGGGGRDGGPGRRADGGSGGTSGGSGGGGQSGCGAHVKVGFFTDPACTEPMPMGGGIRVFDTSQACFAWGTADFHPNSATRMQCFRDRFCYTQHPSSQECSSANATGKQVTVNGCVLDPTPGPVKMYAKILGGTEECPEPPPGFECPGVTAASPGGEAGSGEAGVVACTDID